MTDGRIAELLGWQPERRTWRDSSLMHRIRLIVAEAQAEQDARIARMRSALVEARNALNGWIDQPENAAAYDSSMASAVEALALIDAALEDRE